MKTMSHYIPIPTFVLFLALNLLLDFKKVSGKCLEVVWKVSKGCLKGVLKVSERCLEGVRMVS